MLSKNRSFRPVIKEYLSATLRDLIANVNDIMFLTEAFIKLTIILSQRSVSIIQKKHSYNLSCVFSL